MAGLFYALHLMEREGSGYDMMYETLLTNGKAVPKVKEGDDYVSVRVERRIVNEETIKVMEYAEKNFLLKQKQQICLGVIAQNESVTATWLISALQLKNKDALKSWLYPLIEKGLVLTTPQTSKAKEYRINPDILKNSQYRGRTSLKRIEPYRIKELIVEDLKIYKSASLKEIRARIG